MTMKLPNGLVIIAAEKARKCERCGKVAECRPCGFLPHGRNGAQWCFSCASEVPETLGQYSQQLFGKAGK